MIATSSAGILSLPANGFPVREAKYLLPSTYELITSSRAASSN